jgi:hypothetical protein
VHKQQQAAQISKLKAKKQKALGKLKPAFGFR